MNDEKDIVEVLDEANTPDMPEAPQSISVSGYYKGFKTIFTIRKESNKSVAVTQTQNLIDSLVENGWKASWNEQTNGSIKPPVKLDPNAPLCEIHNVSMTLKPAGISTKTGKAYPAFWACSERMPDGSFCRFKPRQNLA